MPSSGNKPHVKSGPAETSSRRGRPGIPLPNFFVGMDRMADTQHCLRLSRRWFLAAASAAGVTALLGCGSSGGGGTPLVPSTVIYRRSTGGLRASKAAKAHAANRLYPTAEAAAADPAHAGDRARVVPLDTTEAHWLTLFGAGAQVVDLRWA